VVEKFFQRFEAMVTFQFDFLKEKAHLIAIVLHLDFVDSKLNSEMKKGFYAKDSPQYKFDLDGPKPARNHIDFRSLRLYAIE